MRQLFVSHNRADAEASIRLRRQLLEHRPSYEVYLSSEGTAGPVGGTLWQAWIGNAITNCDAVIFVASEDSFSIWCSAELGMARLLDKPIIPLYIGPTPTVNPVIGDIQAVPLDQPIEAIVALLDNRLGPSIEVQPLPPDVVPYPGLVPLVENQAALLFGRHSHRKRIAADFNPTTDARVVIVSGPSGSGKSSLVRAGVMTDLDRQGWSVAGPLRPAQLINDGLNHVSADRPQVVVIDQAEEATLLGPQAAQQMAATAAAIVERGIWLLVVVRSEFRTEVGRDIPNPIDHYLPFPSRDDLYEMIRGPARLMNLGLREQLVDRLVGETGSGEALPLLALTLHELWKRRNTLTNELTESALDDLNGVGGVLERVAESALHRALGLEAPDGAIVARTEVDDVLRVLTRLATPDRSPPTRRPVRADLLTSQERDWIDEFATEGLIIYRTRYSFDDRLDAGRRPTGDDLVDISHEALLAWKPLAGAIERERDNNRERSSIERSAEEWDTGHRTDKTLLLGGDRLSFAQAEGLDSRGPVMAAFIGESVRGDRDRRLKRRLIVGMAVASILALVGAAAALYLRNVAAAERDLAEAAEVDAQALRVAARSAASISVQRDLSLLAAVAAYEMNGSLESEAALTAALATPTGPLFHFQESSAQARWETMRSLDEGRAIVAGPGLRASEVNFASGSLRTIGRGTALDDVAIDHLERVPNSISLVFRGQHLDGGWAVGTFDFNAAGVVSHQVEVRAVTANDRWLVFGDFNGDVFASARGPNGLGRPQRIDQQSAEIVDLDLSKDGRYLAVASVVGVRLLVDQHESWGDPVWLHQVTSGTATANQIAFRRDLDLDAPTELYGSGTDPAIRVWRIGPDSAAVTEEVIGRHQGDVYALAVSPDSALLATAGRDGAIRRWDITSGVEITPPLVGHRSEVTGLSIQEGEPDLLISTDADRAIVWDMNQTRIVERQGIVPSAWSGQSISALVLGDGPIAAVTTVGRVLTETGELPSPPGVTRAWWVGERLVFEQRNDFRTNDGVTAWVSTDTEPELLVERASAIDVGSCLAAIATGSRIEFVDVGRCGNPPEPILLEAAQPVNRLALSSDEQRVAVALRDRRILELATTNGAVISSYQPESNTAVTSIEWFDENTIVTGHDRGGLTEIVDLDEDRALTRLELHDDAVRTIAVAEGTDRFFLGSEDGRLSQVSYGDRLQLVGAFSARDRRIENDTAAVVREVRYLEDLGVLLALQDARVVAWEVRPERLIELACHRAGRQLTETERQALGLDPTISVC